MTTFDKWRHRYQMGGATVEQLQRLVDLGTLTEQEFTTITSQQPDDLALQRWRATADCSAAQAEVIIEQMGLTSFVDTIKNDPETPITVKAALNKAYRWSRKSPAWDFVGPALNLTPTQIDDLFKAAQSIEV